MHHNYSHLCVQLCMFLRLYEIIREEHVLSMGAINGELDYCYSVASLSLHWNCLSNPYINGKFC